MSSFHPVRLPRCELTHTQFFSEWGQLQLSKADLQIVCVP